LLAAAVLIISTLLLLIKTLRPDPNFWLSVAKSIAKGATKMAVKMGMKAASMAAGMASGPLAPVTMVVGAAFQFLFGFFKTLFSPKWDLCD
jgi:hypothetical protein